MGIRLSYGYKATSCGRPEFLLACYACCVSIDGSDMCPLHWENGRPTPPILYWGVRCNFTPPPPKLSVLRKKKEMGVHPQYNTWGIGLPVSLCLCAWTAVRHVPKNFI